MFYRFAFALFVALFYIQMFPIWGAEQNDVAIFFFTIAALLAWVPAIGEVIRRIRKKPVQKSSAWFIRKLNDGQYALDVVFVDPSIYPAVTPRTSTFRSLSEAVHEYRWLEGGCVRTVPLHLVNENPPER